MISQMIHQRWRNLVMTFQVNKFQTHFVDGDTILYQSAAVLQTNFILVTHKTSGNSKRFKGVTDFKGRKRKELGGWLGERNVERIEKDLTPFTLEDFNIEEMSEISGEFESVEEAVLSGMNLIDFTIGSIKKVMDADDYKFCIGGEGNYRNEASHQVEYKGNRGPKPLLFKELRDMLLEKYETKVIVCDGIEAEDYVSTKMYESYLTYQKTKKWSYSFSAIDKDTNMIIGWRLNYHKLGQGYTLQTPAFCATAFCNQLFTGDKTDNIIGLPNLSSESRAEFSLGKTRGVGAVTAEKITKNCDATEMFQRVTDCYKSYYGEEKKSFTTWRGETLNWNWLDYLQESAILLWMRREEDEEYHITQTLDRMGVKY